MLVWAGAAFAQVADPGADCDPTPPVGATLHGPMADTMFGWAIAAGDIDGDGASDLVVGAPDLNGHGGVIAYRGGPDGYVDTPWFQREADTPGGALGWDLAVVDIDADGFADLLALDDFEEVRVYRGGPDGVSAVPDWVLDTRDHRAIEAVGDVDADGFADFTVSSYEPSGVTVWRGTADGPVLGRELSTPVGVNFNQDVTGPGDLDGDGRDDIVAGVYGPGLLVYSGGGLDGVPPDRVELPGSFLMAIGSAGDLDGNGWPDVVAGTRTSSEPNLVADHGGVVLLPGTGSGLGAITTTWISDTRDFGDGLAGVGDFDGDGRDDLLIGDTTSGQGSSGGSAGLYPGGDPPAASPSTSWTSNGALCNLSNAVLALGDANAYGCPDLAFADYTVDWISGDAAGRVWVVYADCAPDPTDTAPPTDTATDTGTPTSPTDDPAPSDPGDGDDAGCGCASTGPSGLWLAGLVALLVACSRKDDGETPPSDGDTDTDADSDADTDADPDTDTAADTADSDTGVPGEIDLAAADARWTGTGDLGWAVAGAGDVDGDGLDDVVFSGPFEDRAFLMRGPLAAPSLQEADTVWSGPYAGYALAAGGDVDGDGRTDVAMTTRFDVYDAGGDPAVRVFLGEADGELAPFDRPDIALHHARAGELTSGATQTYAVAWLPDANGDGHDELVVGNRDAGPSAGQGAVWILSDPPATGELDADATARLFGAVTGSGAGSVEPAGDADGDGVPDLMVMQSEYADLGGVVVVPGDLTGDVVLDESWTHVTSATDHLIAGAGDGGSDATGDGQDDLLLLMLDQDGYTNPILSASLVDGPIDGIRAVDDGVAVFQGQSVDDLWIGAARFAGDVDGDGTVDILVGAGGSSLSDPGGMAALFFGPHAGTRTLAEADVRFAGEVRGAQAGQTVDAAGDVDGDGLADLLIGSPGVPAPGTDEAGGGVYVVLGATLVP